MRTRTHALLLSAAWRCAFALLACCFASITHADVFRPAYLELREAGQDASGTVLYEVMWKRPALGDSRLAIQIHFPQGTTQVNPPQGVFNESAYIERWQISRPGGLTGQTLSIDGIVGGVTDVIVRIERQDGTSQVERLLPQSPQFTVKAATGTAEVAWSYLVLGVEVGQLMFVAFAAGVGAALTRLPAPKQAWMSFATPYAIGCVAMFWVIERVAAFI